MLCVPPSPTLAYYLGAFGSRGQSYGRLLCESAILEFTAVSFVCYICAAEFVASNLILPSLYHTIRDGTRPRAIEKVSIPLSRKAKAIIWTVGCRIL